jgi:hypothetical protein
MRQVQEAKECYHFAISYCRNCFYIIGSLTGYTARVMQDSSNQIDFYYHSIFADMNDVG